MTLFDWSALFLIAFAGLSMIDGVYLHLFKFRLPARVESRGEHLLHTARAVLFVPTLLFVLSGTSSGPALWLGVAVLALDLAATLGDVWTERSSRTFQRGLPTYEAALHVVLTVFHAAAVGLSLYARPPEAWLQTTTVHLEETTFAHAVSIYGLLGGAILMASAHILLMHPRLAQRRLPGMVNAP